MSAIIGISNKPNISGGGAAGTLDLNTAFFLISSQDNVPNSLYTTKIKNNSYIPDPGQTCDSTTKFKIVYDGKNVIFYVNDKPLK